MDFNDAVFSGSLYFSFAALAFMVLFLILAFFNNENDTGTRRMMMVTANLALVGCLAELFASVLCVKGMIEASWFTKMLVYSLNLLTMFLSAVYFNRYTNEYLYRALEERKTRWYTSITTIVIVVFSLLLFGNFFFCYITDFNENGLVKGPLFALVGYMAPLFYLVIGIVEIIRNRSVLTKREFTAILSTHIIVIMGAVLQGIVNDKILFVSFSITIGLYIIYSFLEAPDYHRLLELNKNLVAAEKRASDANKAKTSFLSSMSHEIRTPMNAVVGMNELTTMTLTDESVSEKDRIKRALEYADNIRNAGESLLYVINDILDVTKIESGKMDIIKTAYHIKGMLDDIFETFKFQAGEKGLLFVTHVDGDLPGYVSGDKLRVRQIITNIINNAIKYTKYGSVSVDVSGRIMGDKVMYEIAVSDTGIGIKEENIAHLFETFDRIDNEETHFIEGTGLGLSIVKNLLELMNGEVKVESTYGKGSVFTLFIPQLILSDEKISGYEKPVHEISREYTRINIPDKLILVVDDNLTNLAVAKSFLNKTGCRIKTATSGAEALPLIESISYDLIFMDHMMPGMSGDKVLEEIKSDPERFIKNINTPIIVLTANVSSGIKDMYVEEYGFSDYMAKPFSFEDMMGMIIRHIPGVKKEEVPKASKGTGDDTGEDHITEEKEEITERKENATGLSMETPEEEDEEGIGDVDHIDKRAALNICESTDIYKSIIEVYLETEDSNIREITDYFLKEDWEGYKIMAHALKSSSASLGALNFSEFSKQMELSAGDHSENTDVDENIAYIKRNFEVYIEAYKKVCERFRELHRSL
ncbi:MAG: response regulator [Lachnospiraceae bacterium]|nr:response regulator [Lachnospiraceae bacterium]